MTLRIFPALLAAAAASLPAAASAQPSAVPFVQPVSGTRIDLAVTGEVTRVPDVAVISTGVVTRAATASGAIQQAAARMERVRAALRRAGVADRDIQTSNVSLNPDYVYRENQPPRLSGYTASNQVSVRFRDIANTGKILDALVAEGANQISGPNLVIDNPEAALDEARVKALADGRARAELYARALGKRVVRLLSVTESGASTPVPQPVMLMEARGAVASTKIDPGEQKVALTVSMSFELQ